MKRIIINIVVITFITTLFGCRPGEAIRIINSTKESLEVTFFPIDAIDTLYSLKKGYGDSIEYAPDTLLQKLKRKQYSRNNYEIGNVYSVYPAYNADKNGYINVEVDTITGSRTFTLLPKSKVDIAKIKDWGLCDDLLCPYVGKLIIKHRDKVLIDVEKEEVTRLFKHKNVFPAISIYYLEIKKKDLEAFSKTPKTQ